MFQLFKKIPISIHPFFWILAGVIGWINSNSFQGALLWILVIVVSVLFHEMGHAITAKFFGLNPSIMLVAFGGVTTYEGKDLKFWKQFLIVLNGPLFGIILFLSTTLILYLNYFSNPYIVGFLKITQVVNFFWSIVNLLPVLPLDGGQLLRIALEAAFGIKGFKSSLFIGMLVAMGLSIFFFIKGGFLIGALFFLFGFQSFDMWRKSKFLTQVDRNFKKSSLLKEGEEALQEGQKEIAEEIFQKVRNTTHRGMLYTAATQYLAFLKLEKGEKKTAYKLLLESKNQLPDDVKCILHGLAYEENNFPLVVEYSALCYQLNPSLDVALKNAKAFAFLNKAKPSGGWLQTASQYDSFDLKNILEEEIFNRVKKNKDFQCFIDQIKEK